MTRIFANANYDFLGYRKRAFIVTGVLLALGLIALLTRGLNESIEFTGGTMVQIDTRGRDLPTAELRDALAAVGMEGSEITPYGNGEYVVRARTAAAGTDADDTEQTTRAVSQAVDAVLGANTWDVLHREAIGPKVGGELRLQAQIAILLSFLAVLAYLAYRFEWRFGVAAVVATSHDILLTICFIAVMNFEVGLVIVAAILSMIGYSLNDTIVIFDRVREDLHKHKKEPLAWVINKAVNETLPRTILTNITGLATLLPIAIFGGEVIRPFALVMFFGVFTGTFSSIYIAGPVLLMIEDRWPGVRHETIKAAPVKPGRSAPQAI
jgi:preprotein translocase subunit SecF